MIPLRTIHTQGDLDGACFLYATANAYTALTGRSPSLARWSRALRQIPHTLDFLDPCAGTTRHYEGRPDLLADTLQTLLRELAGDGPAPSFTWHGEVTDVAGLTPLIDRDAVVLFRYTGSVHFGRDLDHWVCGVAEDPADAGRVYAACSTRYADVLQGSPGPYQELHHPRYNRRSNEIVADDHDAHIVIGSVFQIHRPGVEAAPPRQGRIERFEPALGGTGRRVRPEPA